MINPFVASSDMAPMNGVDATDFGLDHRVDFALRGDGPVLAPLVALSTDVVMDFVSFFTDMVGSNKTKVKNLVYGQGDQ